MATEHITDYKEAARISLKVITGKEYVFFTRRCNESIRIAMQLVATQGRRMVLYQDEGGWMTYRQYIEAAGLEPVQIITQDGLIYEKELGRYDHDAVLLINSLAAYAALHDMHSIEAKAHVSDIIIVNDVSGSIGQQAARVGDLIVGSFGKAKPVNLSYGGFIATDNKDYYDWIVKQETEDEEINFALLYEKLQSLQERIAFLQKRAQQVKDDLVGMDIVHPQHKGLNVIVRFSGDEEKRRIIEYCEREHLEYTLCPREIRIMDDAVSIEVKRLVDQ